MALKKEKKHACEDVPQGGEGSRAMGKRPQLGPKATKAQKRVTSLVVSFASRTPQNVQKEICELEKLIWAQADEAHEEGHVDELATWIQDPGHNSGRLALYDRAVEYYWVAKTMMGMILNEREAKAEGDTEPAKHWKQHHMETHILHMKIDALASQLGFPFLPHAAAENITRQEERRTEATTSTPQQRTTGTSATRSTGPRPGTATPPSITP